MSEMSFEETFCKNLARYIEDRKPFEKKGYISRLAKKIGVTQGQLSNVIAGRKFSDESWRRSVADKLRLDYDVMIGVSLIENDQQSLQKPKSNLPPQHPTDYNLIIHVNSQTDKDRLNGISESYRGIPLYESGKLAAGVNGLEFDPYEEPASMVIVYKPELQGCSMHNLAALKVGGDSMEPTITKESIVVVDLSDKALIEGKVFVVNTPESSLDMASIKRVRKWEKGFVLLSDNPKYPPDLSPLDWNRLCVGRVVWMWRNVKDV